MAIDTTTQRSRRALLLGAAGGIAAAVAGSLGRAQPVAAATGGNVILGTNNTADRPTSIEATTEDRDAFVGYAKGSGNGVSGYAGSGRGVYGVSSSDTNPAVVGWSAHNAAVMGYTGFLPFPASQAKTGVYGYANEDATAVGVRGSSGSGTGVRGVSFGNDGIVGSSAAADRSGVWGSNAWGGYGVAGSSNGTALKAGVWGSNSASGVGVRGTSASGRGGLFSGGAAQLRLSPSTTNSHPSSGQKGDLFVDKNGGLWFCKGGTTWKQLA
jgi:hypothetical protein